jgi:tRNA(Ile2) C34 agmatinyltransferase TiaS
LVIVGIDDTDVIDSPGTNQLARAILKKIGDCARDAMICRHQLFFDPRVPYTSKNGSASIRLPHAGPERVPELAGTIREVMADWFVEGSDPGLCLATTVTAEMRDYGLRCKDRVVTQEEAHSVAARSGCYLEGLGGTEQGVVGALAAVGLFDTGDDGRVVHLVSWSYPDDDFNGVRAIEAIIGRGVNEIRRLGSDERISEGLVDIGKHLRPNRRGGRIVLYVDAATEPESITPWRAVKIP